MPMERQQENQQILDLVEGVKGGKPMAFERLTEIYRPMLDALTARFANTDIDREDLRQEALIAFYGAVLRYDCEREGSATFGQFAKVCVRNGIISSLRAGISSPEVLPLEEDSPADRGMPGPAEDLIAMEDYAALSRKIRDSLSAYENRIWWLYLSGRTAKEIAEAVSKNEKSVQNAICRIRKKLRAVIPNP